MLDIYGTKNMKNEAELLREYVRAILKEEGGGSDSGGTGMVGYGSGSSYGSSTGVKGMGKALLHPLKVFMGKTKELGASVKNLGKVSAHAIASIATAGAYRPDYKKLKEAYTSELNKLKQENAPLYAETRRVLDRAGVTTAAFLYNPALYITAKHPGEVFRVALATAGVDWVAGALGIAATGGAGLGATLAAYAAGRKISGEDMESLKSLIAKNKDKLASKAKESAEEVGAKYRQAVDQLFKDAEDKAKKLQAVKSFEELPINSREAKEKLKKELQSKSGNSEQKFLELAKQSVARSMIQDLMTHRNNILGNSEGAKNSALYKRYTSEIVKIAKLFSVSETGQ
jgi:iron-sulfur cluster repair protein YtfE (RIC family)